MNTVTKYHVIIEEDLDGGFVGRVPELEGCITQGDTIEELMSNIKEAIQLCVEENLSSDMKFFGVCEVDV